MNIGQMICKLKVSKNLKKTPNSQKYSSSWMHRKWSRNIQKYVD